ncbi:hypothetical protein V8E36_002086 [Tilletia maclaganii]
MSCQTAPRPAGVLTPTSICSQTPILPQQPTAPVAAHDSPKPAELSKRGQSHAAKITPFWTLFDRILQDAYCIKNNPDGVINMGIANNSLMEAELLKFANTHRTLEPADLTYGTSLFGSTRLFNALSHHFNTYFDPFEPVQPEHIITGPGCGSLLDQLATHLLDEGDAFLCAGPLYNGFSADAEPRAGARVVAVRSPYGDREGTEPEWYLGQGALTGFEEALLAEEVVPEDGSPKTNRVKAVLLCQPHNPVGRCYDRAAVIAYGQFCQKHNLTLISDEIYALSTFSTSDEPSPQPFVSALSIDWAAKGVHPSRINVIYSASKDTGMNGIRVGCLVSQHNHDLMAAMKVTAKLNMVGSPSDALFSALLTDATFFPRFVLTNRARLAAAYETLKSWLLHHGLSYTPSNAGHFVMVDFTPHLPKIDNDGKEIQNLPDADTMLWAKALENKVAITPGSNYAYPRPGVFRVTFSLLPHALIEGVRRLETVLGLDQRRWTPPAEATRVVSFGTQGLAVPSTPTSASKSDGEEGDKGASSSVEEAILGFASPTTIKRKRDGSIGGRAPRRRRHTDGAGDGNTWANFDIRAAHELSMDQLTELRRAVSCCC